MESSIIAESSTENSDPSLTKKGGADIFSVLPYLSRRLPGYCKELQTHTHTQRNTHISLFKIIVKCQKLVWQ